MREVVYCDWLSTLVLSDAKVERSDGMFAKFVASLFAKYRLHPELRLRSFVFVAGVRPEFCRTMSSFTCSGFMSNLDSSTGSEYPSGLGFLTRPAVLASLSIFFLWLVAPRPWMIAREVVESLAMGLL
jgi:hypothetical protein